MTELKTLKDLIHQFGNKTSGFDYVDDLELKQEAIKWIKDRKSIATVELMNSKSKVLPEMMGQIKWIEHFFNITEDDLK